MLHMRFNSIISLDSVGTGVPEFPYILVPPALKDFHNSSCEISLERRKVILSNKALVSSWKQVDDVYGDWALVSQSTLSPSNIVCSNMCFKTCTFPLAAQKMMSLPRSYRDGKNGQASAPQIPSSLCSCNALTASNINSENLNETTFSAHAFGKKRFRPGFSGLSSNSWARWLKQMSISAMLSQQLQVIFNFKTGDSVCCRKGLGYYYRNK